jgi:glycine dehydrogenase
MTLVLAEGIKRIGFTVIPQTFFDTITVRVKDDAKYIHKAAEEAGINLRKVDDRTIGVTIDETVTKEDITAILDVFCRGSFVEQYKFGSHKPFSHPLVSVDAITKEVGLTHTGHSIKGYPTSLARTSSYLTHPVFNSYHSETEMLRYIFHLSHKDLSLADAMIPLGSCTMKLNATTEMIPVTWPEFNALHPFVPSDQALGYKAMLDELVYALSQATGFDDVCLQPNSGAQGEYTGLVCIFYPLSTSIKY